MNIDGNLAALRAEERRQQKQNEAWERIQALMEDKLDELQTLAEEIRNMNEHSMYDFSEDIDMEIKDRL